MTAPWSAAIAISIGAAVSFAATGYVLAQGAPNEATVVQREIAFDNANVTIRAGGNVIFVNEDRFGHNVFSETAGGEFDVGRQAPNTRIAVPFRRAGTFAVLCRIHPRMSMTVTVVP